MLKKFIILGSVLLIAGAATLGWVFAEKRKEKQRAADYKLKYGSETNDYLKQYNEWLQLPPEERAQLPFGLNRYGKTKDQIQQEQQERLEADLSKLAVGEMDVHPFADVLYGENWQNELTKYKKRKELSELAFSASILCTLTGGAILSLSLLLLTSRLLVRGSSGLAKFVAHFAGGSVRWSAQERADWLAAGAPAKAEWEKMKNARGEIKAKTKVKEKVKTKAEAKAKAEAEKLAKAKMKAKAEAKEKIRAEAEAMAKAKAEMKAKAEADKLAKAKEKARAKAEAKERARAEAEAMAKTKAEIKAKAEAERKAKAEAEKLAKAEEKARAKAEAEERIKAEAEAKAERKAKAEAEKLAKAEEKARAKAEAKEKVKAEAEAKAKAKAERKAKAEAEKLAKAEEEARAKAEEEARAKAEEEARAKAEAEAKAKAEAEAKAKAEAEAKAKAEAEAKAKAEAEEKIRVEGQRGQVKKHSKLLSKSGWQSFEGDSVNEGEQAVRQRLGSMNSGPGFKDSAKHAEEIAMLLSDEKTMELEESLKAATENVNISLKLKDSLKAQTEDLQKQMAEFKQMAQSVQQAAVEQSDPISNTLTQLTQQMEAIREYATGQQGRLEKLQDGYDWNIIKTFCLRVIRCIDNLENRISQLSEEDVRASHLKEIKDELIFALESSGVEQFEPKINSSYRGQEKFAEAIKEKESCKDSKQKGKIAKVIRPGYQYFIDEENVKVVRTAQVKLFG